MFFATTVLITFSFTVHSTNSLFNSSGPLTKPGDMELQFPQPMVAVCGAFKRYSSNSAPLLRGFSMTVPAGAIYGLLGPSGCGKTTLLNCIAGCRKLDSGEIKLGIRKRSELGYMPQEVALYEEFTIEEIFQFYGKIFNMSQSEIHSRMLELLRFFELPLAGTICRLSGGQQRRVSFAVALLHNPKLLILDEPTVGVDPVLCAKIWDGLVKMSREEKKTIIITTHYIEEARQCQLIGLMRSGILLAEDSPLSLMTAHNSSTLEHVFLELSQKQHEADIRNDSDSEYPVFNKLQYKPPTISSQIWSVNRFIAQLQKNIFWLKKNIPILVFLLALPLLLFSIYCSSFGKKPTGLPIGIVTNELDSLSDCDGNFTSTFSEVANRIECYVSQPLSCLYLQHLHKEDVKVIEYQEINDAQVALSRNKVWSILYFSKNFTNSLLERIDLGLNSDKSTVTFSTVDVWMDMSNTIIGTTLKRTILKTYDNFIGDVFNSCGGNPGAGKIPIKVNDAIHGGNDPEFSYSTLPGYILSFGFYLSMMFTSGALMLEKLYGHLERKLVAGMTMLEILLAHTVVQCTLMIFQTIIILWTSYGLFYNPMEGNFYLIAALLLLVEFSGMCYGFLLSEMYETDRNCSYTGIGSVLALFLTTGVVWPVEGAHKLLKSVMWALPVNAAVTSYQSLSLRGLTFNHPFVYKGFISVSLWIFFFSLSAFIVNRIKKH